MLFFKHLYLICNIFYNTLSYSYVLHSTSFHTLVSDLPLLTYSIQISNSNLFYIGEQFLGL